MEEEQQGYGEGDLVMGERRNKQACEDTMGGVMGI